jgi:hypothetical protein
LLWLKKSDSTAELGCGSEGRFGCDFEGSRVHDQGATVKEM